MALAAKLPLSFFLMILVVILLFGKVRQSLIIWLTVPLSIIGVTTGLLLANKPFDFMALLGFLSLTGMLIKNGIVLIDEIDLEIAKGKETFQAVVDSALSRARPVSMAALTTIMGVAPLLFDPFFASMAVLIMCGLAFATLLTLFVVPILYTLLLNNPSKKIPS
jgi:multidrug efflux pump subunit AcrB